MNVRDLPSRAAHAAARPSRPIGKGPTALLAGAAALAAAAVWNTTRARRAEREHPPTGRFLEVDGVRLHYLERGTGPAVVLLHGNVVSAEDYAWSGVLDRVAERHRVVAIDRPGFGHSTRPHGSVWSSAAQASLLRRVFDQLGLDRPIVVGHSWGTLVALALALDHPETVGGLVLLSGYYKPTVRLDVPLVAPPAIPVLGDLMRYTVSPLLGRALLPLNLKGMFAPLPLPERFRRAFPYGFPVRPSQVRAEAQDAVTMVPAVAAMRQRYQEGLRDLPVTIMAGVEDRVVGVDGHARWFHDVLPHSELRLVPGTGHMFHYAVPEQVADAIAAVADAQRARGGSGPMGAQPASGREDRTAA
jgi:pimeloyl-ACP methyl ester carboxylesterase